MFVLKKIGLSLLTPPGAILLLALLGLARLPGGRGRILLGLSVLLLALLSIAPGVDLLLVPLEGRYPALIDPRPTGATAVVVLDAGGSPVRGAAANAGLGRSLTRLAEGVRLWRALGGRARLVLCGGSVREGQSSARLMGEAATNCFGVPSKAIALEERALDTGQSALLLAPMLARQRFILVTSATHMPRSVAEFRAVGLAPIPAPTDYLQSARPYNIYSFLPSGGRLEDASVAAHEWLGLAWQRVAPWLHGEAAAPLPAGPPGGGPKVAPNLQRQGGTAGVSA